MKCKKCRKAIPDNSKFCNHCGAPQEKKKLYRRPDGLYEKVMTIDGKRVYFRARKEADVYKKIHEYEVKREEGPLFTEVAEQWHTEHWENLSPTTQHGYEFPFEEIKEYFADKRIKELTLMGQGYQQLYQAAPEILRKKDLHQSPEHSQYDFQVCCCRRYRQREPVHLHHHSQGARLEKAEGSH